MRKFICLAIVILAFQAAQADQQKLSQAYEQQLIERVKSVFSPTAAGQATERPICATPIFLEVHANWDKLSLGAKKLLEDETDRPVYSYEEHTYDTPVANIKIHYVREGTHSVPNPTTDLDFNGHPDWVDGVADVLEHVWDMEIGVFHYNPPPSDDWYADTLNNGGDGRYDIYLWNLGGEPQKYLGYTNPEFFASQTSASVTSHIVLDNDYADYGIRHTPLEWLQVTAAHEFFHAVQMGYDGTEYESDPFRPYWMEMSAVWMEEMVYDDVNDYVGYLPYFYDHPEWSLKTFDSQNREKALHAYGSCVWPMYLQERFDDTTIIKEIWDGCALVEGDNAMDYSGGQSATDKVLQARGMTFEEAFREFSVWNYFTGHRARTQFYFSEGDTFPEVEVDNVHQEDTLDWTQANRPPENLGINYVVFETDLNLTGGLRVKFDGHGIAYQVSAVGYSDAVLEPLDTTFLLNPVTMSGQAEVYNWNTYSEIVMIPAVTERSPDFVRIYDYQAEYDDSLYGEARLPQADQILQNYPNPFEITSELDRTYFPFVLHRPSRVRIDIFTLSGERIKTIIPRGDPELWVGEYLSEHLAMPWDGRNEEGEYVSSGVYLYRFRTDRNTEVMKIAVIR